MKKIETKEELFIPKTKHKGLKITLAILLVIGLITGGYFLYQYKFNNPNTIVANILNDAKENYSKKINEINENELYKVDGHINIDSNINEDTFKILKDLELLFSGEIDQKNSISNIDIDTKYKNDELATIKLYREGNIYYALLNGVYDKYLKIENEEVNSLPKINYNRADLYTIYYSMISALEKELSNLEFKKSNETISINGKETKVINNYVELKDNELNKLSNGIINTLKNDKKFIEAVKRVTNKNEEEILESLKIDDEEEFKGTYTINFYTDRNLFNKKLVSVRISIGGLINLNVDKISDEEIFINLVSMGSGYSINVKNNKNTTNIDLSINMMGQYIKFEINMTYEKIKEMVKPDVSNYKNLKDLTEKEKQEIQDKLKSNKALINFMDEINKMTKQEA